MSKKSVEELLAGERDIVVFVVGEVALYVVKSSGKVKDPTIVSITLLGGRMGVDGVCP